MNKARVGLVGCGYFSENHINAWLNLDGVEIACVCDIVTECRNRAAVLAGGVPAYDDLNVMLTTESIDFVDIVTGPETHALLAGICAERGVPCIIQKPLAPDYWVAKEICKLSDTHSVSMMVHENFRFQPQIRQVQNIIRSGEIGNPFYCHVSMRTGFDIYSGQPYLRKEARLILMDIGVHVFDVSRFLMGNVAALTCCTNKVRKNISGEDTAVTLLRYESGATGVVECSYGSFLPTDIFPQTLITVEGDAGSVVLSADYILAVRGKSGTRFESCEPTTPKWAESPWHVVQRSVLDTCRHWLESWHGETNCELTVADNLETLAMVEAAYLSADRGETVKISEITMT